MIKQFLILILLVSFSFGRIVTDTVRTDYIRSNPNIDSTKGNTIHTGTYTVSSTASVDSLNSTNGIVTSGSIWGSGSLGLKIQTKTVDGTDTSGVFIQGGGDYNGGVTRGAYIGIYGNEHATHPGDIRLAAGNGNGLTTGAIKFLSNGAFTGRVTATDFQASDTVKGGTGTFSGALTGTTLNTGNGDNELYPMNQNVSTTASVSFANIGTWTDYSATSTVVGFSSTTTKTIYYQNIGKLVIVCFDLQGTSNSAELSFTMPLLPKYAGGVFINSCQVIENGVYQSTPGAVMYNYEDHKITVYKNFTYHPAWATTGSKWVRGMLVYLNY